MRKRNVAALLSAVLVGTIGAAALSGCGAVRGRRGTPEGAGFLRDYSQLSQREGYEAQLVYVNPDAEWSQYDSIMIDSVTLWASSANVKLSRTDQQMLTDLLYRSLERQLGAKFRLAKQPGSSTLRLRAALTQATGANVPLRTISTFVPQLLLVSTATGLSADVAATVGSATIEAEVLDSITNERLAAMVDQRAGTKTPLTTRTFSKWGDVEAAGDFWAERATTAFVRMGVRAKS